MIFYFSGCGNSKYVAEYLSKELGENLTFIPEAAQKNNYKFEINEEESVGFVFPVYCWAPPYLVTDFVKQLQFSATPRYLYMIVTCGDDIGMTETMFSKTLRQKGLELNTAISIQMPNTYINIPGMNLDSDEVAKKKVEEAQKQLPEIVATIAKKQSLQRLSIGSSARLKSYIIKPLFYKTLVNDKRFVAKDSCTQCGICIKNCPLKNLTMGETKPQWNGHCTTCMSCYHRCPQNAIQFGKATEGKGQYFFGMKK